jgi:lantibiotic modifying enzyme
MSGAAGALLAVLAVHARSAEPRLLNVAKLCGEHLLRARGRKDEHHPLGWSRSDRPALTGFSHGAAGIGLALSRLAHATGDARYEEGALTALAFERHWYSAPARNWADLRRAGEAPVFMTSWCHGAPGIGLSRAAWEEPRDGRLRAELAAAVETSAAACGLDDVAHLCCGHFGRFELLTGSDAPAGIREQTARALARVVTDANRHGGYRLFHDLPRTAWTPGFFRGTAGIGYTLLRRAAPSRLPNVLTLD